MKVKWTIDMEDEYYYAEGKTVKLKDNKLYLIKSMKCLDIGNTWTDYEIELELVSE